jgi:surface antigen
LEKRAHAAIWQYLRAHRSARTIAAYLLVVTVIGIAFLSSTYGQSVIHAFAQGPCSSSDQTYIVRPGDTLNAIAKSHHTTWQKLAARNQIANPNLIFIAQRVCIPGGNNVQASAPTTTHFTLSNVAYLGSGNPFPYGQCTWWANERYHQLHGVYVPWSTNANAWQWTARAYENGWQVSSQPAVGSIIDLQPNVQGAYGLGHVGVVESVLGNGQVVASSMNWGSNPGQVTSTRFRPGSGVTFISQN